MKKVYHIISLIAICIAMSAAQTTYYSTGSSDAGTVSNWNSNRDGSSGSTPANFTTAGDVFVIQGTGNGGSTPHAMTLASALTIGSGTNNTKLQIENGASLTATGTLSFGSVGIFQIDNGGTYNHNGAGAFTSLFAGVESFGASSNFAITGATSPGTGPSTVTCGSSFGNFTFAPTSTTTLQCNDRFPNVAGNFTKSSTTAEFRMAGNTAGNGGFTISGNLLLSGGIFSFGNGTVVTALTVSGNITMSAGTLLTACTTNPSTNTLTLNKSGVVTFSRQAFAHTITANNSSGRHIKFVVPNGTTLDMGTDTLSCSGSVNVDFDLQSGATLKLKSPGGIVAQGTSTTTGQIQTSSTSIRSFSSAANYVYNGTVEQVTGTGLPSTVNNLTIDNAAGVINSQAVNVDGVLTLQNGVFDNSVNAVTFGGSGSVVTVSGSLATPLPVELVSFTASTNGHVVQLRWATATELNNSGFEVQKQLNGNWKTLGFVDGAGTSNARHEYSYSDKLTTGSRAAYRLKQIDRDGQFTYSSIVEAAAALMAADYALSQNYPNPFNPATSFSFAVKTAAQTTVKVYNLVGQEVATLFNGVAQPDQLYTLRFDAKDLPSGIYLYSLRSANRNEVKKMLLLK